ncbi:hypothetical protein LPN04_31035 [Rugamonas sp. A1-17]|nr:hypothetical protein [Rugamonas sp. A1-17]
MNISVEQRTVLIAALNRQQDVVAAERKRRSEDCSRKWNDSDERIAIELDARRDQLHYLIEELQKPSGTLSW